MKEITLVLNTQLTFILKKSDEEAALWEVEKEQKIQTGLERLKEANRIDNVMLLDSKVFIRDVEGEVIDYDYENLA